MREVLIGFIGIILTIVSVYLIVRIASTAYFKTLEEFLQRKNNKNKTTNKRGQ